MDYKVVLSPPALEDLERIVRYVARHDPQPAGRLGNRLLDRAETLRDLPHHGGNVRRRPCVNKLLLLPYRIFYRVNEESRSVDILRFWHGAGDPRSLRLE